MVVGKMTKKEFLEYVKNNNIDLKKSNVIVGEKSNTPFSIGCYEEGSSWHLYEVDERQNFSILKSGEEKEIFNYLYFKLRGIISRS